MRRCCGASSASLEYVKAPSLVVLCDLWVGGEALSWLAFSQPGAFPRAVLLGTFNVAALDSLSSALEPPLSDANKAELIETCLNSVLCLPPPEAPKEKEGPVQEAAQKEVRLPAGRVLLAVPEPPLTASLGGAQGSVCAGRCRCLRKGPSRVLGVA